MATRAIADVQPVRAVRSLNNLSLTGAGLSEVFRGRDRQDGKPKGAAAKRGRWRACRSGAAPTAAPAHANYGSQSETGTSVQSRLFGDRGF